MSAAFLIAIANAFGYVNAQAWFGPLAPVFERAFVIYMVLSAIMLASLAVRNPFLEVSILQFVAVFSVLFIAAAILLLKIPWQPPNVYGGQIAGYRALLFTIFVVAATEELIFRGVIPHFLVEVAGMGIIAAHLLSNLLFAAIHWAAYNSSPVLIGFAFIAGCIFSAVRIAAGRHGLSASTALHASYNARVLALLAFGIPSGVGP